jgi:hypothetical protein
VMPLLQLHDLRECVGLHVSGSPVRGEYPNVSIVTVQSAGKRCGSWRRDSSGHCPALERKRRLCSIQTPPDLGSAPHGTHLP